MTALILHQDPGVSYSLEQDFLASGAMVFISGNAPGTEHYEVSNPHHHAALVYRDYNKTIFGGQKSQELAIKAISYLVIESDILIMPEELTDPVFMTGKFIAEGLGIPVVKTVAEAFGVKEGVDQAEPGEDQTAVQILGPLWCSGCKVSGDNPLTVSGDTPLYGKCVFPCSSKSPTCRFFPSQEEADLDALSDESISDLEIKGVPYFDYNTQYQLGHPSIKRGAIVFPGGVV